MPVTPTYPGVYIEEIPSGVRTIIGVATSITALIGRALRGPTDEPLTINSFGDFERIFGGLWVESSLGYAVRDFFLNGGSQAIVVRLYHADPGAPSATPPIAAARTKAKLAAGEIKLEAAYEGSWGGHLRAAVDLDVSGEVADRMGLKKEDLFNLTVTEDVPGGNAEKFLNLSLKDSARQIDKVLEAESRLVRWDSAVTYDQSIKDKKVAAADDPVTGGQKKLKPAEDELKAAEAELKAAKAESSPDQTKIAAAQKKVDDAKKKADDAKKEVTDAKNAVSASDGLALNKSDFTGGGKENAKKGLYALRKADLFNILCIPPHSYQPPTDIEGDLIGEAAAYCEKRRAMFLVDPPSGWNTKDAAKGDGATTGVAAVGTNSKNSALFFPRLKQPNPFRNGQMEDFAPCGAMAGIFSRTDSQRGVWKAPAGLETTLVGVPALSVPLTDNENGELNPLGINCLRVMPAAGRVAWGARTLQGNDRLASEWKYIPVRRTALFLEESLYRALHWVVFEPNDEPLWAQIRLNVGAFMNTLFRQGAFQGTTPRDAYFVKCDKETTTQNDIDRGIVNIVVGFAPLKPAEFVIIKLQQIAGQIQT